MLSAVASAVGVDVLVGLGVLVGGTAVFVGLGVLVGGTGVAVGGTAVLVIVGVLVGSAVSVAVGVAVNSDVGLGGGRVNVDVGVGSGTLIPARNWKLLRIFIKSLWATCAVSTFRSTLASKIRRLALYSILFAPFSSSARPLFWLPSASA